MCSATSVFRCSESCPRFAFRGEVRKIDLPQAEVACGKRYAIYPTGITNCGQGIDQPHR
jgi:hypothetical protein